jgi:hypothetical protein
VKSARREYFTLEGKVPLHNGDGICFIDASGELGGTNIEIVEDGKVYPHEGRFIRRDIRSTAILTTILINCSRKVP